jgi:hypothetical protein
MNFRNVVIGLAVLAVALAAGAGYWLYTRPFQPSLAPGDVVPVAEYRFSGPITHENLTVYLIHGRETVPSRDYLTLQEALASGKVVVHETGEVQELSIENLSDEDVFVQAGDVVKGGQQDRTIPNDFIVPPQSGRLPIDSFCVEHGRWTQRGKESVACFDASSSILSTKELKLANARSRNQSRVWDEVANVRRKVVRNLGKEDLETESKSSYQLLTEQSEVQEAIKPYLSALEAAPGDAKDVVGVVVVVNGKVSSAEVFGSTKLFAKLWPKLLRGAAVEAFADREADKSFIPTSLDEVQRFLADAEAGGPADEAVTARAYVQVRETSGQVMFDTCDRGRDNVVIHRSFIAR